MKVLWTAACIGLLVAALSPKARANEWNEKTVFTFSGPVEIPGKVLPAGTYVFTLADSLSDRDIVQVWNKGQTKLLGTFLAIPDQRLKITGKPVISFEERPAGSPIAVKAWFYPGDNIGEEFVYPKTKAIELAKQTNQPVPSMPDSEEANITKPMKTGNEASVKSMEAAPLTEEEPNGQEEGTAAEMTHATHPAPQALGH